MGCAGSSLAFFALATRPCRRATYTLVLVPRLPFLVLERVEAVQASLRQVGAAEEDRTGEPAGRDDVLGGTGVVRRVGEAVEKDNLKGRVLLEEVVDGLFEEPGGVQELQAGVAVPGVGEEVVVEDELDEGVSVEDEQFLARVDQDVHPLRPRREPGPACSIGQSVCSQEYGGAQRVSEELTGRAGSGRRPG